MALPDYEKPPEPNDDLLALIAVLMDSSGPSIRLFSTNIWVIGETWYRADRVCKRIDFFDIDHAHPPWLVNRWITGVLQLFHLQVVELIRAR